MRQYLHYSILFSVIFFASHTALADPYFANSGTATPPPATSPTPTKMVNGFAVPTVLSPQEFSNKVESVNKQTESRISQEVAKALPKPVAPTTTTAQPTAAPPTVTTQPQQPQQPVYSGFGAAPAATQPAKPTKTAPQSGGWQIQY